MRLPNWLRQRTALDLAMIELNDAKRELLAAQTSFDLAAATVEFHESRVARLTRYVKTEMETSNGCNQA